MPIPPCARRFDRLNDTLGQLLNKQGHAVRLDPNLLDEVRRQGMVCYDFLDHRFHLLLAQSIEHELREVRAWLPGGVNSGRNVSTNNRLVVGICSMSNERNSSDDGSAQWRSSH